MKFNRALTPAALFCLVLGGCGGGSDSESQSLSASAASSNSPAPISSGANALASRLNPAPKDRPTNRAQAARFLNQATMGAKATDIDYLMTVGYSAWIDKQFTIPSQSYVAYWNSRQASLAASGLSAGTREIIDPFYIQAATAPDQLRQRVSLALSEIFVISTVDSGVANFPQAAAAYVDMLHANAFGNYANLLKSVTLSPAMGTYLTSIRNLKEDTSTGREPDQNYAREVMQLFSIGLYKLNSDGTVMAGNIPTYGAADIFGMAKVFTGWSWGGPDMSNARFYGSKIRTDYVAQTSPMQAYPQYHSISEKEFLGVTIAPSSRDSAPTDLGIALASLSIHHNRAPFIAKQMIQRLTTSNPSPAYVSRAAFAFKGGDLKSLIRAILLDPEARSQTPGAPSSKNFGKLKEPLLRLTQFLRATGAKSDSGDWLVGSTDDPSYQLGQSFLRAPSVFNFFRPGYVKPHSGTGALGLVAPELQIFDSNTSSGYANYMLSGIEYGFGMRGLDSKATRRDVHIDWTPWLALAAKPQALVAKVETELFPDGSMTPELRSLLVEAVSSIPIPTNNAEAAARAQLYRVELVHFMSAASPEFIVAQ